MNTKIPIDVIKSEFRVHPDYGHVVRIKTNRVIGALNQDGYLQIVFRKITFQCHHIAFVIYYGKYPEGEVDHRDGDRTNNKKDNLRDSTKLQNAHNRALTTRNTSGYKGVSWDKDRNRWIAMIWFLGKKYHLGRYKDPKEAATAYEKKANELHGEYSLTASRET